MRLASDLSLTRPLTVAGATGLGPTRAWSNIDQMSLSASGDYTRMQGTAAGNTLAATTAVLTGNFVVELKPINLNGGTGSFIFGVDPAQIEATAAYTALDLAIALVGPDVYCYANGAWDGATRTWDTSIFIDRIGSDVRVLSGADYAAALVKKTLAAFGSGDLYASVQHTNTALVGDYRAVLL